MNKLNLSSKFIFGFGILTLVVIISSIITYVVFNQNIAIINKISKIYSPSVTKLQTLQLMIHSSTSYTKEWVFAQQQSNMSYKQNLRRIHNEEYEELITNMDSLVVKWDEHQQQQFAYLKQTIADTLFVKQNEVMVLLKTLPDYDIPENKLQAEAMVSSDDDIIIACNKRVLAGITELLVAQQNLVQESKIRMERLFRLFKNILIIIGILLAVTSVVLAITFSRIIVRPIVSLMLATQKLENGQLDTQVKITTGDEIEALANAFNKMAISLKMDQEQLTSTNQILEEDKNELETLNQTLESSLTKLSELNATKDKFFSIIAHDMKSPFHSILGFSELILTNYDIYSSEKIKENVSIIHQATRQAYILFENLLMWAMSQTGKVSYKPERIDLERIVQEVVTLSIANASKKEISLGTIIDRNEGRYVMADEAMLKTVLRNLVSNAIKFTYTGGKISIRTKKNNNFVELSVKDSGIGIDDQKIDKLFKIDNQLKTKGTNNESGTGLGLVLCKEFVEQNGGKIWVESKANQGSCFIFTVPIAL